MKLVIYGCSKWCFLCSEWTEILVIIFGEIVVLVKFMT